MNYENIVLFLKTHTGEDDKLVGLHGFMRLNLIWWQ